ncbi:ESPR-type extended signal peptide-containing protein [Neisseria cinerea]|uniref:ESPR-type extended signal peptide-containing protein n=1 Tax=Neisseria cinerea TaxID=483 RepID=UPI00398991BD
MNKHRHKIVFNRTCGILMAVAETAIGQGKSPGERSGGETGGGDGSLKTHSGRDLCKKALPSTAGT